MNLNSPLFDRIRTKPRHEPEVAVASHPSCNHPGCQQHGEFRAPMGRLREGQYFCFCLDHVREYNASYNYFNGMSDMDVALYQKDALTGHRPTWTMGGKRAARAFRDEEPVADPLDLFRNRARGPEAETPRKPKYGLAAKRALTALGLDEHADSEAIKTRYKELVKRLHPDANGGDRSREDKLREIIQAYNHLRAAKLVG